MKFAYLSLVMLFFAASISAQSVTEKILTDAHNLAPKNRRGDFQKYNASMETVLLSEHGKPKGIKTDRLSYTQLCLANDPDTGIAYQVTIDTLMVGQVMQMGERARGTMEAKQYQGFTFDYRISQQMRARDNCYDFHIDFPEGTRYLQSYELTEYFTMMHIFEQLRFTAGRRLSRVGDEVSLKLPSPVCYKIPEVVEEAKSKPPSFTLRFEAITNYRGQTCAKISLNPQFVDIFLKFYSAAGDGATFEGTVNRWGEFLVNLKTGHIVYAQFRERNDSELVSAKEGADAPYYSRGLRTVTVSQIN